MPNSFVWLDLISCVFTCSIFVESNTKRFLSVLGVFGKYFVFTKTEKFQKQCCPILATQSRVIQVACYSRELAGWFWRLVRRWKVQSRGVHRDFHVLAHDSLTSETSSRKKHLANFFKSLGLNCFGRWPWRLTGDLFQSQKTSDLHFKDSFSLEFLWLFTVFPISLSTETDPNTPQTLFLHHFFSNLQEKGMGFLCLTSFSMFWVCFS